MCGISGIIFNNNKDISKKINIISSSISNRGPDGTNVYISTNVAFAHNRLGILDKDSSFSKQPVFSSDLRYSIIYNGEIYNHTNIKNELISLGYKFNSNTDTETVLNSFIQWGSDCVFKFEGMWAFAIWDKKENKLFLSRDRFGIKPLYYAKLDNNFYFCSQIRGLKEIVELKNIDRNVLNRFEYNEYQEDTIFTNIKNLKPGHSLIYENKKLKCFKWRKESFEEKQMSNQAEVIESYDQLLKESCKFHSASDRDLALSISGGLDSSVLLYTFKNLGINFKSFSTIFESTYNDESEYLHVIERDLDIKIERNIIRKQDLNDDNLLKSIKDLDLIWSEPCIGQWLHYKKMRSFGYNVCIEGHGPDETLGGYDYHFNEYIKNKFLKNFFVNFNKLNIEKKTIFSNPDDNSVGLNKYSAFKLLFDDYKNALRNRFERSKYFENILKLRNIMLSKKKTSHGYIKKKYYNIFNTKLNCLNSKIYEDVYFGNMSRHLAQFDRLSMSSGIEVRVPYITKKIIEASISLNENYKIKEGYNKKILRDISIKTLPEKILSRKKKIGFSTPMQDYLNLNISKFIIETSKNKSFLESNYFDGKNISKKIEKLYKINDFNKLNKNWKIISAHHLIN
jgi:asparagine synthase (glutamine-hydrolysing)